MRKLLLGFCALLLASVCAAQSPQNEALEKHVMAVSEQLRCLVCKSQTIADSHADLAVDLRNQVREKIQAGMTDQQIFDYMVERYGDFVMYRPPLKSTTWLLWFGPFLLLILGLGFLVARVRQPVVVEEISEADQQRSQQLLSSKLTSELDRKESL
ncbi:cytochrome c-type biogenesis protein [Sapientia aquatica]|uniref:Cytochrome c-type biogenesis protein n=1 Tax=Sapientia aquatica TaxID=1549640 RepID=A0A4R5W6L9_9BURK|nr:cytochrome c-type biogenesis protein [Sapientia aquatica]TDK67587.1 cytochrome c-type biogenesis protein CcmH [Sapientia aquatica]